MEIKRGVREFSRGQQHTVRELEENIRESFGEEKGSSGEVFVKKKKNNKEKLREGELPFGGSSNQYEKHRGAFEKKEGCLVSTIRMIRCCKFGSLPMAIYRGIGLGQIISSFPSILLSVLITTITMTVS